MVAEEHDEYTMYEGTAADIGAVLISIQLIFSELIIFTINPSYH